MATLRRFGGAAIPYAVGIWLALIVWGESPEDLHDALVLLGVALGIGSGVALAWRRTHPELVTAGCLVAALGIQLIAPAGVIPVGGMVAVGSLAAARPPRISLPALAALIGVAALNFITEPAGDALFAMAMSVVAWALGEAARTRRVAIAEERRRAITEEQARIARELHDVIAHSVSVIVVQAGAADDVFDEQPERARAALRAIESAGRDALRELRRLLGAVRTDSHPDAIRPQPGLARLDDLVEALRSAGLEVAVHREEAPAGVAAGVDLSAYRIVQEAFTNTLRHAHATRADVSVRYRADALELDVRDNGDGGPEEANGGGHGIVGMRERAALIGGTLEAGPRPEGGYRVHAVLPLGAGQ